MQQPLFITEAKVKCDTELSESLQRGLGNRDETFKSLVDTCTQASHQLDAQTKEMVSHGTQLKLRGHSKRSFSNVILITIYMKNSLNFLASSLHKK